MIALLAEDSRPPLRLTRMLGWAVVAAVVSAAGLLVLTVGLRPDLAAALGTGRVEFKIGVTALLAVLMAPLLFGAGRPGESAGRRARWLLLPLACVVAAVLSELVAMPADSWGIRLVGRHAPFCLVFIPTLALVPLAAFLAALRLGAPDDPGLAGTIAGLAAGALAAAVYAWHCPDDSPLFVATWYTIAIAIVTAAGRIAGRRLLAW